MGIFEHISEWIQEKFGEILDSINIIFDTGINSIVGFVDGILADIVNIFAPVETLISNVLADTQNLLISAYDWLTDQAKGFTGFVTDTFDAVVNELGTIYSDITSWLDNLTGQMTDWIESMGKEVKSYFDMGYELLQSFFTDQWKQISDFMTLIKDSIVDGFDDTLGWVIDKVQESFDTVKAAFLALQDWMIELWNSFTLAVSDIVESFEASISDLVDILTEFIQDLWDDMKAFIDSLSDYTQEQLESFLESAMTAQFNIMKKLAQSV